MQRVCRFYNSDALESGKLTEQGIKQKIQDSEMKLKIMLSGIGRHAELLETKLTTVELLTDRVVTEKQHHQDLIKSLKHQVDELQKKNFGLQFELENKSILRDSQTRFTEEAKSMRALDRLDTPGQSHTSHGLSKRK